jgi:alkanesulfonate monooxygenase SsuD/methylene tetrahydromethanopterin reductase-like flavin-dependent oxidoreductase (luciferase family)
MVAALIGWVRAMMITTKREVVPVAPLALANITQPPAKFAPLIASYRQTGAEAGHDASRLKVALASHLHVADTSQQAADGFYPFYSNYFRLHAPKQIYAKEVSREGI